MKKLALITAAILMYVTAGMAQTTYSNIESMSGISACSTCAGAGGNGSEAVFSMQQNQTSPAMDGKSTKFSIGGTKPYSDAMWTKRVSGSNSFHHFAFETYYYVQNPAAIQGLEFNITNYASGKGYTFGFTCSIKDGSVWKMSVPNDSTSSMSEMHWQSTGISCPAPKAYSWIHVQFEGQRTSDNKVKFISLTINGSKHYLNQTVYARKCDSGWGGVTTHVQLNGDSNMSDYSLWADKWKVTLWN